MMHHHVATPLESFIAVAIVAGIAVIWFVWGMLRSKYGWGSGWTTKSLRMRHLAPHGWNKTAKDLGLVRDSMELIYKGEIDGCEARMEWSVRFGTKLKAQLGQPVVDFEVSREETGEGPKTGDVEFDKVFFVRADPGVEKHVLEVLDAETRERLLKLSSNSQVTLDGREIAVVIPPDYKIDVFSVESRFKEMAALLRRTQRAVLLKKRPSRSRRRK